MTLYATSTPGNPMETASAASSRAQQAAPAILGVLAIVILAMLGDVLANAMPFRPGDVAWRYQIAGFLMTIAPQLALVLMLILAVGFYGDRLGAVKAAAIVCLMLAGTLALLLPFFALDFLTVRHLQSQSRLSAFQLSSVKLAGTSALLVPALAWAGLRGVRASRVKADSKASQGPGLLIGQQ